MGDAFGFPTWRQVARPDQLPPPGDWSTWLILTGRGWGKTRTAAETVRIAVEEWGHRRIGILGPTEADLRDVMIEGESGLLSVFPDVPDLQYLPGTRRVLFPNGAIANLRSADEPRRMRGLQFTFLWADELCAWRRPEAWDLAQFGNRLRDPRPRAVVTTTPLAGHDLLKRIIADPRTVVTRGSMRDNAPNLSAERVQELESLYGGTDLGRQELEGELLEESAGALWRTEWFAQPGFRLPPAIGKKGGDFAFEAPVELVRVVVALDPAISDPERKKDPMRHPDACGCVVMGLGANGRAYVLGDFTETLAPPVWARLAVRLAELTKAVGIVAEANQGGELIREVIEAESRMVRIRLVHASMGKRPRAEPVALLYEQGRVSHCGTLKNLEEQMTTYDFAVGRKESPNNIDALVWGFHGLGLTLATGTQFANRLRVRQPENLWD